jgi:hypothetical protein
MTDYQNFADKYWPRKPDERAREIYHLFRVERKTQKAIAEQYGISQGRVSQIVRQVEQYDMVAILLQHSLPEEKLRAKTILRDQVSHAQQLAMEDYLRQREVESQLSRTEDTDAEGKVKRGKTTRSTKRGKGDGKLLELYVSLGEKVAVLDVEVAELRLESHALLSTAPDWKEDHDAHFVIQIREELQRYEDLCKELDRPCPELPKEEKSETEEWTRHERRENPNGDMWNCVHPKWLKVAKMVFMPHLDPDEPMPRDCGDLKSTTVLKKAYPANSSPTSSPAPEPVYEAAVPDV